MCQPVSVTAAPTEPTSVVDERRARIHEAAIHEFSERGFSATSMARIAETAGMSRPALYQYFKNKDDIFASAFVALMQGCTDRALAALAGEGTTAERLDGLLQRFEGDLWERMSASAHSADLVDRKSDTPLGAAVDEVMQAFGVGLTNGIAELAGVSPDDARVTGWVELLRLAPRGFKTEAPPVAVYRRRLSELASVLAVAIDGA